jgi:hypothetical protein
VHVLLALATIFAFLYVFKTATGELLKKSGQGSISEKIFNASNIGTTVGCNNTELCISFIGRDDN